MYVARYEISAFSTMNLRDLAWALNNLESDAERMKGQLDILNHRLDLAHAHQPSPSDEVANRLYERYEEYHAEYLSILAQLEAAFEQYALLRQAPR